MSNQKTGYGMLTPIHLVVLAGIVVGAIATSCMGAFKLPDVWIFSIVGGIGLAYVLLGLVDCILRARALAAAPLDSQDVSDRAVARELAESLPGTGLLARHSRRLLAAWGAGATGQQVSRMAATQLYRALLALVAEGVAIFAVVAIGLLISDFPMFDAVVINIATTIILLLIPLVTLARIQGASRESGYIESQFLARIGNDTPAAATTDFAQKVETSVNAATARFADTETKAAAAIEAATAKLADAQQKALAALTDAQTSASAAALKASTESAAALAKSSADAAQALAKSQAEAAAAMAQGQTEVAKQLERVTALAASIEKVLDLQKSVDGTLKSVSATDEFKSTLLELKRHLAESDELIKTATKPRRIRFVENPAE
ncbi:MAG: hypothetical protein IJT88_01170 [Kiritimatiellae bacterium]|nr:hypothetical protein [Kiritimatiellia bacterium]